MADLTLTTKELINAEKALGLISGASITPKGAYALRKARTAIAGAMATYHAARLELAVQHAKKDDAGAPHTKMADVGGKQTEVFDMENQAAFDAALAEIQSEPVTLSGVRPVTLAEFGSASISELAMTLLGPLVIEGDAS